MSYLGWRWTEYLTAIMAFSALVLVAFFIPETYPPVILVGKAAELRRRTRNWGIHAKQEKIEVKFGELMSKNLTRPLRMLVTEPIVLFMSIYMAFVYGLLYLFLEAYPIVFQEKHGMNLGVGGLPYFGQILGYFLAGFVVILFQPRYQRKLKANNDVPVPEWRLPEVILGGVVFATGIFWFGWTGNFAGVHWMAPTAAGVFLGFGVLSIFLPILNYVVDAYLMFAASAVAALTIFRSICGAGFPLFANYAFNGIGVGWFCTILGCVAALLVPVPIWLYLKGSKIRERSNCAPTGDAHPLANKMKEADEKEIDVVV